MWTCAGSPAPSPYWQLSLGPWPPSTLLCLRVHGQILPPQPHKCTFTLPCHCCWCECILPPLPPHYRHCIWSSFVNIALGVKPGVNNNGPSPALSGYLHLHRGHTQFCVRQRHAPMLIRPLVPWRAVTNRVPLHPTGHLRCLCCCCEGPHKGRHPRPASILPRWTSVHPVMLLLLLLVCATEDGSCCQHPNETPWLAPPIGV